MSKDGANITKKATLITVDSELKEWSKSHIKNFSGFVEEKLREFSASVAAADALAGQIVAEPETKE